MGHPTSTESEFEGRAGLIGRLRSQGGTSSRSILPGVTDESREDTLVQTQGAPFQPLQKCRPDLLVVRVFFTFVGSPTHCRQWGTVRVYCQTLLSVSIQFTLHELLHTQNSYKTLSLVNEKFSDKEKIFFAPFGKLDEELSTRPVVAPVATCSERKESQD